MSVFFIQLGKQTKTDTSSWDEETDVAIIMLLLQIESDDFLKSEILLWWGAFMGLVAWIKMDDDDDDYAK